MMTRSASSTYSAPSIASGERRPVASG
ncbi:hypothetical protein RB2654_15305 [Rhodobacterales bacterium HTCC2654]|uniref:Uncharacterized protein n=1 Tax=Maritimibacter alkaliphilus HTCC2654 TaxID=314271 RepID=A3VHB0_9RHOB|nr:hypothetical protein RB2654_15305 [Rhodobacterales bacterium HTCC2654] [Maritimibacter alkaliphilus HTCC2654]